MDALEALPHLIDKFRVAAARVHHVHKIRELRRSLDLEQGAGFEVGPHGALPEIARSFTTGEIGERRGAWVTVSPASRVSGNAAWWLN
jgi:hypothetical protein